MSDRPPLPARLRLAVILLRPPLVFLVASYAMLGLASAGRADDVGLLAVVMIVVAGYVLCAVALNDLADQAIDRANLPDDLARPLANGRVTSTAMKVAAATGAVVSLGGSLLVPRPATAVVSVGLALAAAYSLPPVQLSHRGLPASLLLPAGYVAVPFAVGILAGRGALETADLVLLAGLWVGFIGRIVLKDFRDLKGDLLYGKRTFLIRHGRRPTCTISAICWVSGSFALVAVRGVTPALIVAQVVYVAVAVRLLVMLGRSTDVRRDEWLVSAVAIVGRGMIMGLVLHLALIDAGWSPAAYARAIATLLAVTLGQARAMVVSGPMAPVLDRHVALELAVGPRTPSCAVPSPPPMAARGDETTADRAHWT